MLQELTASLQQSPSESRVLEELSRCISSAVNADGHKLFLNGPNGLRLYREDKGAERLVSSPEKIFRSINKNFQRRIFPIFPFFLTNFLSCFRES